MYDFLRFTINTCLKRVTLQNIFCLLEQQLHYKNTHLNNFTYKRKKNDITNYHGYGQHNSRVF